jgi:NAD(P)-dependent dehydrogenase (short-subunit alcohol dehydrogenase family)
MQSVKIVPEISQQTVLITGAASGLGRALAGAFGDAGAALILLDISEDGLRETAKGLAKARVYAADLADADSTRRVIEDIRADHPAVHTLIHNAGFLAPQPFAEMTEERWNLTFNVGIQAAHLITRAFWHDWLQTGAAAIYVSSRSGIEGFVDETAYCATKHAIEGFVKALAMESTADGIFVHTVTPGMYMHTPMSERIYPAELKAKWVDPMELTPAFLRLALRGDPALSGQRLDAWKMSQKLKESS